MLTTQVLADGTAHRILGIGMGAVILAVIAAYAALFIGALIGIVRSSLDMGMKVVWLVFAFVAPFIGSLLWFLVGRKHASAAVAEQPAEA